MMEDMVIGIVASVMAVAGTAAADTNTLLIHLCRIEFMQLVLALTGLNSSSQYSR